jgi:eukaryotic-like serine/threonine-protein kinase
MMADSTLQPGHRLDRYELLSPIASGGMAVVWLARLRAKRGFEKFFAIKTIKTELIHDARYQEMFLDEARIASGIHHPNVAQILDLGEQDDVLYIVMEWVDGESLAKIRKLAPKRGIPVPLGFALRIMADACAGLHAAHQLRDVRGNSMGVVHRDVSPQNILVSAAGSVKVIDFGIAKATSRSAGETKSGIIKGKIHYMAPEQAKGRAVDRRVDIWAAGVCLFELVTGKLPFDSDGDVDVVRRLLSEEPAPSPDASVPEPVAAVLTSSLARDPETRFSTAAAMQRAIEHAIDELDLPATDGDVADFLRENFSDLAEQRAAMVTGALESADRRAEGGGGAATPRARPAEDFGFAPTVMSSPEPGTAPPESLSPPTKRAGPAVARPSSKPPKEESKLTLGSAALEMREVAGMPKRRGWMWTLLLIGVFAGGLYGWRGRGVDRVRALIGSETRSASSPATPTVAPAAHVAPSAPPSTIVTATAADAATFGPPGSASSAPGASAQVPLPAFLRPGAPHPAIPRGAKPSPATVIEEPPPTPAPAPAPEDPENPYN